MPAIQEVERLEVTKAGKDEDLVEMREEYSSQVSVRGGSVKGLWAASGGRVGVKNDDVIVLSVKVSPGLRSTLCSS